MITQICSFLYKKNDNRYIRLLLLKIIAKIDGGFPFSNNIRQLYSEVHNIEIGYGSYGGCFDLDNIPPNVTIGNYCSFASNVKIFRANHPLNLFTTHPITYNPVLGYVKKDMLERRALIIGHDVWIGANVIILPSVTFIGNGAVIGAGSVVTKNINNYEVVAGNPAKVLKKRFSEDRIKNIELTEWWKLKKKELMVRMNNNFLVFL